MRIDPGPCYGPDCDHVSHAATFTDLDLYQMMQKHLAPTFFWPEWDRLSPEMRNSIMALANEIYGRLRGG